MRRLADRVQRSGSALGLELGPLEHEELTALLEARTDGSVPAALANTIVARSEGNPFFAEELLAAAGDRGGELPRGLRDLLLQRVTRLDRRTQALLRVAAAAGRDVAYPLLCAVAALPEREVRESLRRTVEHVLGDPAGQVTQAWMTAHELRYLYRRGHDLPDARRRLHDVLQRCVFSDVPELLRLARTLDTWRDEVLAYFTTQGPGKVALRVSSA